VEGSPYTFVASPVELARGVDVLIVDADGYRVNNARGSVVDEDAFVEALVGGRLAGGSMCSPTSKRAQALLTMDNVLVLPHVASGAAKRARRWSN